MKLVCSHGYTLKSCSEKDYSPCGDSVCEIEQNSLKDTRYKSYNECHGSK